MQDAAHEARGGVIAGARRFFGLLPRRVGGDSGLGDEVSARVEALGSSTCTTWLRSEYLSQLAIYDGRERTWLRRQTMLSFSLVGFGLIGSVSAALGSGSGIGKTLAIIAGALVASLTTINQVWSPAARSEAYRIGYSALRDEGWDYVLALGAYKQFRPKTTNVSATGTSSTAKAQRDAYDAFNRRVTQIDKRTRNIDRTHDVARHR